MKNYKNYLRKKSVFLKGGKYDLGGSISGQTLKSLGLMTGLHILGDSLGIPPSLIGYGDIAIAGLGASGKI